MRMMLRKVSQAYHTVVACTQEAGASNVNDQVKAYTSIPDLLTVSRVENPLTILNMVMLNGP